MSTQDSNPSQSAGSSLGSGIADSTGDAKPLIRSRPLGTAPLGALSGPSMPKAIGNQVKKQEDVTRQGKSKLMFKPNIVQKKTTGPEVKQEPTSTAAAPPGTNNVNDRGRGRGRGDSRGRGRGRGFEPAPMTASGPFAQGPAMAGNSESRRAGLRTAAYVPITPVGSSMDTSGSQSFAPPPMIKKDIDDVKSEDEEVYSDAEGGVTVIDMANVRTIDWMAPESLRSTKGGKGKKSKKIKKDDDVKDKVKAQGEDDMMDSDLPPPATAPEQDEGPTEDKDTMNALDLSESEGEEEMEDLVENFINKKRTEDELTTYPEQQLYFFQFPAPFPTFQPPTPAVQPPSSEPIRVDIDAEITVAPTKAEPKIDVKGKGKAVSFAAPADGSKDKKDEPKEPEKKAPLEGLIGHMDILRSGAIKIRLGSNIIMDVSAATQPSFLQQLVYIDQEENRMIVLGEVNKRFIVSPDVEVLLDQLEEKEIKEKELKKEGGAPVPMNVDS